MAGDECTRCFERNSKETPFLSIISGQQAPGTEFKKTYENHLFLSGNREMCSRKKRMRFYSFRHLSIEIEANEMEIFLILLTFIL